MNEREPQKVGFDGGTLSREHFEVHWPNVEKLLDNNPEHWADYYTKESIYNDVVAGNMQAWAFSEDGVIRVLIFTRIINYPATRVLHVLMAFGNAIDRLLPQIEATLENFGRIMECKKCEIVGREGWSWKLGHRFKKRGVLLTADIPQDSVN